MSTIQQDVDRVAKYKEFVDNLSIVGDLFINGDVFVKSGNETLTDVKNEIDSGNETAWTKKDFNDMLELRAQVLAPIIGNISFAAQFTPYILE